MTRLCAALGAVVLAALAAFPAAADPISDAVERAYRPLLGDYDVPGMVVAVTVRGERRFFRYGVTAGTGRAPATEDTLFEIGSVSKTFAATLAAYAAALGKLSLDDHPGEHLPELRGTAVDRASLIELGAYAAGGLPLQFPPSVTDEAGMLAYFRQWTPTSKPGVQRRYSNPSVGLMGRAAAAAMGGDFASVVEEELLPKLGLARTFVRVPDAEMGRYAWGHDSAGKPIRVAPGVFDAEAYGIKSTAADMLRFVEANIRPETLDPAMRSAVEATHAGRFRVGAMTQGLGWESYPWPVALERLLDGNSDRMAREPHAAIRLSPPERAAGPTLFNKTGSTNGFGAYVAFVPEERIGLVMLANRNFPIAARLKAAHAILEELSRAAQ